MGLVNKVIPLSPSKRKEINAMASSIGMAALYEDSATETIIKSDKMTIADVKANPEIFAALKADILAEEKDRMEAFAAFAEIDPKAVLDAIVKGDKFTQAFGAQMQVKAMSKTGLANVVNASAAPVNTPNPDAEEKDKSPEAVAKEKELEAFNKEVAENVKSRYQTHS
jgi:hypothetical protein